MAIAKKPVPTTDALLALVGAFSRYQVIIFTLMCVATFVPWSLHSSLITFIGSTPPHRCVNESSAADNGTVGPPDSCGLDRCERIVYDADWGSTMVTEFELLCSRAALPAYSQLIYAGGGTAGCMLWSHLSDSYGRKPVLLTSHLFMLIVGICASLYPTMWGVFLMRGCLNLLGIGALISGYTFSCEIFPSQFRKYFSMTLLSMDVLAILIGVILAYFIRNWRLLSLTVSCLSAYVLLYYWILPESVVWLFSKRKYARVQRFLRLAAKINGQYEAKIMDLVGDVEKSESILEKQADVDTELLQSIELNPAPIDDPNVQRTSIMDIVRSRRMLTITIVASFMRTAMNICIWSLHLTTGTLSGDRFTNFVISCLFHLPGILCGGAFVDRIGRRMSLGIYNAVNCVLFLLVSVVAFTHPDWPYLNVLTMSGKMTLMAEAVVLILYTPELFPTSHRAYGSGITLSLSMLGFALATLAMPFAGEHPWLAPSICCVLAAAATPMVIVLPETMGRPLADTIEQIEAWSIDVSEPIAEEPITVPTHPEENLVPLICASNGNLAVTHVPFAA